MNNITNNNNTIATQNNYYYSCNRCTEKCNDNCEWKKKMEDYKKTVDAAVSDTLDDADNIAKHYKILVASIKRQKKVIDVKNGVIAEKDKTIADQKSRIEELERKLAAQTCAINLKDIDIKDKTERIAELKKNNELFKKAFQAYESSKSQMKYLSTLQ